MYKYPEPYVTYLVHFQVERDYFECHEVLEAYWKQTTGSAHSQIWHGLIQLAVALYHERRDNRKGAVKMLASSINKLADEPLHEIGIDKPIFIQRLKDRQRLLQNEIVSDYFDIDIPIADSHLLEVCEVACQKSGLEWGKRRTIIDEYLFNKHTLRDRSDVVRERAERLKFKMNMGDQQ